MAVELFTDRGLREAAQAEFDAARGADYEFRSLFGARDRPVDYRK